MKGRAAVIAGGVVLATALAAYVGVKRASGIVTSVFGNWAAEAVAQASDSVYQLSVGTLGFDWTRRRVTLDSIRLMTIGGRNAMRPQPRTALHVTLTECSLSGIRMLALVRRRGLRASSFGCAAGSVTVAIPRRTSDSASRTPQGFMVMQQSLTLPASAPRILVDRVSFPRLAFDFRLARTRGGDARFALERLDLEMTGVEIDPADSATARRPLFSRDARVHATNFSAHPDSTTLATIASVNASLTDSTVELVGGTIAPTLDDIAYARASRYDRTRVDTRVARVAATGVDFGALAVGEGISARRVEVDTFRLDAYKDKRRPPNPVRRMRRTPQRWIADLDAALAIDSLVIRGAHVTYRERRAGRDKPGVLTFAAIDGTATNVHHVAGRRSVDDLMTLHVNARLQDAGALAVTFEVPLDAPSYAMNYRGTLGAMPATSINALVEELFAMRIDRGTVDGIVFGATVREGFATGSITPRFRELSVSVTEEGSGGILGRSGRLGGAARGIVSFAANLLRVRSNNPDTPTRAPRSGIIAHRFAAHETLPGFLWAGLRDGLLEVVRR